MNRRECYYRYLATKKETVKSLDDACEEIKDLFDQKLKQYANIAKMNIPDSEDGLSPDESASIHLYTIEWDVHNESLYMILNRTLRAADRNKLRPWFKYLKLLLTAFYKLPPSEHTLVWRGVREDLSALYPKGKEFAWWALSSCTASISVLESPNYLGKSGTRTIFSIQTNSGKHIGTHSYFENEDEILLPPGIYLKVIDILNPAEGLHIIQLREIPAPHKMLADPFDLSQMKKELPKIKPLSQVSNQPPKEENHSTTSVVSKPSKKQENHPVTSVVSVPPAQQETPSATSVVSKPSVESAKNDEKSQITVPKNNTPYSQAKLDCKGRACAVCGRCRDWYWSPGNNDRKVYTKRSDAKCTRTGDIDYEYNRDYYDGFGGGHRSIYAYWHRALIFGLIRPLCECDDNCS